MLSRHKLQGTFEKLLGNEVCCVVIGFGGPNVGGHIGEIIGGESYLQAS
jgi:hypothetical protein